MAVVPERYQGSADGCLGDIRERLREIVQDLEAQELDLGVLLATPSRVLWVAADLMILSQRVVA